MNNKNNDNAGNGGRFQLDLSPELALGEYANLALISHSSSDFVIDFARMLPGLEKPRVCSRILIAPEHAKRLLMALQENIYRYEKKFGKIDLHEPGERTISPFTIDTGEA